MKIINNKLADENPSGTGVVVANNILLVWDEEAPAGWTGKINRITNPAKICGVAAANISKVMGD